MRTSTPPVPDSAPTELVPTRYESSAEWHQRASRVVPGGVNSNVRLGTAPIPLFFQRGEGAHLFDVDGNRYLDYALGMGPDILGHAHPAVSQAAREAIDRGQLFAGQHSAEVELAEKFVSMVPCAEVVRFSSSGTEAVQAAIRLARASTGRNLVVKFDGHYHGWLDNVYLSMAPTVGHSADENSLESAGQSPSSRHDVVSLPWNDEGVLHDFLIERGSEVAAVIMEPIMANTSLVLPSDGYLEAVRALCTQHQIVLIFDEIITGFRIGPGGAQEKFGVVPDLATYGKAMANGFTISAIGGKRSILELAVTANVVHSGTYNANCIAVATSLATLQVLDQAAYTRMHALGDRLRLGIAQAGKELGLPLRVQGVGTMFSAYFSDEEVTDYASHTRVDGATSVRFVRELLDLGVRPTSRGTWFLSTEHTEEDVDQTLEAVRIALSAVAKKS